MPLLVRTPKQVTVALKGKSQWLKEATYDIEHNLDGDLVVDLSTVDTICTDELNELIRINAKARQRGRFVIIENVQDQVWQVFRVTRLDRLFQIRRDPARERPRAPHVRRTRHRKRALDARPPPTARRPAVKARDGPTVIIDCHGRQAMRHRRTMAGRLWAALPGRWSTRVVAAAVLLHTHILLAETTPESPDASPALRAPVLGPPAPVTDTAASKASPASPASKPVPKAPAADEANGSAMSGSTSTPSRDSLGVVVLAVPTGAVVVSYDFAPFGVESAMQTINVIDLLPALDHASNVQLSLFMQPDEAQNFSTSGVFLPDLVMTPGPSPTPDPDEDLGADEGASGTDPDALPTPTPTP